LNGGLPRFAFVVDTCMVLRGKANSRSSGQDSREPAVLDLARRAVAQREKLKPASLVLVQRILKNKEAPGNRFDGFPRRYALNSVVEGGEFTLNTSYRN
jgi:hypothetical protein